MNAEVDMEAREEKSNDSFLITLLVLECMKETYQLSTSECTSLHSSKWRKEPFILNHTSCIRMLTIYESNLPPEKK